MNKTAVITGATSGIGAAFARRLAQDGYDLVITGRKKDVIQKLADDISKQHNIKVTVIIAELTNDNDFQKLADVVKAREDIEMLINNAGYSGWDKHFDEVDIAEHEKMVKLHQVVPMRLVSLVVPGMIKRRKGAIINVSSSASFLPMPTVGVYGGTKAFMKYYSQSLSTELKDKGIKVQALCPGFTETNFAKDYYSKEAYEKVKKFMKPPKKVVESSLSSLKKNKLICIPDVSTWLIAKMFPALPWGIYCWLGSRMMPFK
jgi:uncharacterized protein